jgi:type II secretory pathway component PulJ
MPPPAAPCSHACMSRAVRQKFRRNGLRSHCCSTGFTLVELLVSVGVLVLLILLATQLLNSAATITTLGHKRMDADSQGRQLLDRMATDFTQMVKRPDVDYYLKSPANPQTTGRNDQLAFYSSVPGYYGTSPSPAPGATTKSPVSLVGYRVNSDTASSSYNRMERLGKGLAWNGFSSGWTPVVFLPLTISSNWSTAVSTSAVDLDYEVMGPQVFRFEYYYLLKNNGSFTATPWDAGLGHSTVNGMRDVAAIVVDIAVIDPRSKVLVTVSQMERLAGTNGQTSVLIDYSTGMTPGQLLTSWRSAIDANTIGLPQPAISGIRLYERFLYLSPPTLGTP